MFTGRQWLTLQALPNNSKVEVTNDGRYKFKPPYQIFDKAGLLKLLRKYLRKGLGVILLDDVKESLPDCSKAIKVKQTNLRKTAMVIVVDDCNQNRFPKMYIDW